MKTLIIILLLLIPVTSFSGNIVIDRQIILSTSVQVTHLQLYQTDTNSWVIEVYYQGQNTPAAIHSDNQADINRHFNNLKKYLNW